MVSLFSKEWFQSWSRRISLHWIAEKVRKNRFRVERTHRRTGRGEVLEHRTLLAAIIVNTPQDNTTGGDGLVTLREAINAANADATTDLGHTGSGADTILFDSTVFAGGGIISLTAWGNTSVGVSALYVGSDITIDGPGGTNGVTIARDGSAIAMRLFFVGGTGSLTLNDLTLSNGVARGFDGGITFKGGDGGGSAGLGGAIYNQGTLTVRNSLLTGNLAIGGNGGNSNNGNQGNGGGGGGGLLGAGGSTIGQSPGIGGSGGGGQGGFLYSNGQGAGFGAGGGGGGQGFVNPAGVGGAGGFGGGGGGGGSKPSGPGVGGVGGFGGGAGANGSYPQGGAGGGGAGLGGAIFTDTGSTVTITNSTLTSNTAQGGTGGNTGSGLGGGLFNRTGTVTINNTTMAANTANDGGGGVYNLGDGANAILNMTSCIVANTPNGAQDFVGNAINGGASVSGGTNNLIELDSDFDGSIVTSSDPQLAPLSNNGGPTQTMALLAGSPAIDTGVNLLGLTSDQRGAPFTRSFGAAVDIGAFEVQSLSFVVDTATDEEDGNYNTGDLSLREAIGLANMNPGADTITFDAALNGTPLLLTLGQLTSTDTVTITGNGAVNTVIDAQSGSRILNHVASGDLTLDSLTLQNGRVTGEDGGAVQMLSSGNLTITNSTLSGNSTSGDYASGGAIFTYSGNVTVSNSTLSGNSTVGLESDGGAVYTHGGNVTVTNSTLSGNSTAGRSADGGAILATGIVTVTNSTLSGNSTSGRYADGGAIFANGSTATITNSTLSGNFTSGIYAWGGAIISAGEITTNNSTLSGNFTMEDNSRGGAMFAYGNVTVIESTLSGNTTGGAGADGGAIYSFFGNVSVTDSTLSSNSTTGSVADGGAIRAAGRVTITNSTLSGNSAAGSLSNGGGVYAFNVNVIHSTLTENQVPMGIGGAISGTNITVDNSIVAGNSDNGTAPDIYQGGTLTVSHSLIGDNKGTSVPDDYDGDANGNFVGNSAVAGVITPQLGPLQDNGGPTFTHALLPGSVALDSGSNALAEDPGDDGLPGTNDANEVALTTDQRGVGFNRMQGGIVDMGAFEYVNRPPTGIALSANSVAENAPNGTLVGGLTAIDPDTGETFTFTLTDDATGRFKIEGTDIVVADGSLLDHESDTSHQVTVQVEDSAGNSFFDVFTIIVTDVDEITFDYGDLPDTYSTLLASDGARHTVGDLFLGTAVTADADGQPGVGADLDANDDGVLFPATLYTQLGATANVTASQAGLLDAFIDFNGDGDFDTDERITPSGGLAVEAGANLVTFTVPDGAVAGQRAARFRLSTAGGLAADGAADDGEVEDYLVNVVQPALGSVLSVSDPENPSQTMLLVTGTNGNDIIHVSKSGTGYVVTFNRVRSPLLPANSRITVFGLAGDDTISVANTILLPSLLDGGTHKDRITGGGGRDLILGQAGDDTLLGVGGDDTLYGGIGHDKLFGLIGVNVMFGETGNDTITGHGVLLGGADNDTLTGTGARNVLIGGLGTDTLKAEARANFRGDILIGGTTDHDANIAALLAIRTEWATLTPVQTRIDHLTGALAGGLNGLHLLVSDAVRPGTVHDDFANDTYKNSFAGDWLFLFPGDLRPRLIGFVNHT